MHYHRSSSIVYIKLEICQHVNGRVSETYGIFCLVSTFLQPVCEKNLPWEAWGPSSTRWFDKYCGLTLDELRYFDLHSMAGYRAAFPSQIIDFNKISIFRDCTTPYRADVVGPSHIWKTSVELVLEPTLITPGQFWKTAIVSRLPFRRSRFIGEPLPGKRVTVRGCNLMVLVSTLVSMFRICILSIEYH